MSSESKLNFDIFDALDRAREILGKELCISISVHNESNNNVGVRISVHSIKLYSYQFLINEIELSRPELAGVFNFRFHQALRSLQHHLNSE